MGTGMLKENEMVTLMIFEAETETETVIESGMLAAVMGMGTLIQIETSTATVLLMEFEIVTLMEFGME